MISSTCVRLLTWIFIFFFALAGQKAAAETCDQVIVRAEFKTKSNKFIQKGAGIVYSPSVQSMMRQLVVPSHVILGAQKVVAICGNTEIPVKIIGQSVTADVAVGTIDSSQTHFLKPLFFSSGVGTITAITTSYAGTQSEIRVPSEKNHELIKTIPVDYFNRYLFSFMNPIYGDQGGIMLSSGVVPGMSGSALMINGRLAGVITKSFANDSLSAAVFVGEILSLIPALENGIDPYLDRDVYLTGQLVENPKENKLHRMNRLHVKSPTGWIEYYDICESSHWSSTSAWAVQGGWGEGSGSFLPINGLKNELIQGLDIPTLEQQTNGGKAKPVAFYVAGRSDCAKEGVVNNIDQRRLVGLVDYPDEYGNLRTIRINSVNDLMPLAQTYGQKLLALINKRGLFAEVATSPITQLCDSDAFKRFEILQGSSYEKLQIYPSAESGSQLVTMFWLEHLDVPSRGKAEVEEPSTLTCDRANHVFHFKMASKERLLKFNLQLTSQRVNGFIEFGSCKMDVRQQTKDFWQAELSSADMDWGLDLGVNLLGRGIIHMIPRKISPHCLRGTDFESSKIRLKGFTWIAD